MPSALSTPITHTTLVDNLQPHQSIYEANEVISIKIYHRGHSWGHSKQVTHHNYTREAIWRPCSSQQHGLEQKCALHNVTGAVKQITVQSFAIKAQIFKQMTRFHESPNI